MSFAQVHRGLRNPSLWLAATCSRRRRGRRGRLALPTGTAATGDYGADHGRDWERVRNAYARLFDIIDVGGPTANDSGALGWMDGMFGGFTETLYSRLTFALADECLAELFAAAQSVHAGAAAVSTKCLRDVMSVDAEAHGYHLTHKWVCIGGLWQICHACKCLQAFVLYGAEGSEADRSIADG